MRKSIVRKVFVSIMSILVISLVIQLVFQMYFIDDVYTYFKRAEIEDAFNDAIFKHGTNFNEMTDELNDTNHIPLLVVDSDGVIVNENYFEQFSYLTLNTEHGPYKVILGKRVDERGLLIDGAKDLTVGNSKEFTGALLKNSNVIVLDAPISNPLFDSIVNIDGEIIDTHYLTREGGVLDYQPEKLLREVGFFTVHEALYENNINFQETETGLIINLIIKEIDDKYAIILYTIENLSYTFAILNQYYIYIFLFQVVLLSGISFVYTRWFTRPLKVLNEEAKAIAEMDFSFRSNIKTGDELEELSQSLEYISESMESNIEKLKKDAKEKSESEERMRELLANLSHEYKTPLGIMSGFLEMLEADYDNKDHYIETINGEIDKLNELTKETLLLCESENYGEIELKYTASLLELCDVSKFCKTIEAKGLKFIYDVNDASVVCDRRKIITVIENLMSNAIKYSEVGETISIISNDEGDRVKILVKNTGVTIDEENLSKIWHKYYRIEKSRNKDYGGNGIGLAITKNILEAHNSDFGVYNEDNAVVFYFYLNKA